MASRFYRSLAFCLAVLGAILMGLGLAFGDGIANFWTLGSLPFLLLAVWGYLLHVHRAKDGIRRG